MTLAAIDEGMLATLFHARLDLPTGLLRYVDAGHGHCLVRRANGRAVALEARSRAFGAPGPDYAEDRVLLRPGDTLLVHTDGLVDAGDRRPDVAELADTIGDCADANEMVERLLERVRGRQADDVTVVVLHRCHGAAAPSPIGGGHDETAS
jgi:serine phosphatase RsbU (regulator of sigma subunit)